mmetsp:Transcript_48167/g.112672  ORF Transcript_48167/g.112672 Transcript_48167/m.112672 type:complete len:224 (+) Transcript_48167:59-730(+)
MSLLGKTVCLTDQLVRDKFTRSWRAGPRWYCKPVWHYLFAMQHHIGSPWLNVKLSASLVHDIVLEAPSVVVQVAWEGNIARPARQCNQVEKEEAVSGLGSECCIFQEHLIGMLEGARILGNRGHHNGLITSQLIGGIGQSWTILRHCCQNNRTIAQQLTGGILKCRTILCHCSKYDLPVASQLVSCEVKRSTILRDRGQDDSSIALQLAAGILKGTTVLRDSN